MSVESASRRSRARRRELRATMLAPLLLGAALIAPASLRSHRPAVVRARAVRADAAWLEPPPVGAWPEALCGPWEVRSSLPNAAETWVELGGDVVHRYPIADGVHERLRVEAAGRARVVSSFL